MAQPAVPYVLPWNESERQRLGLQHRYLFECVYEKQLLPVKFTLSTSARILDSGAGCADWLLDVATAVPEGTQLEGIDITGELLPKTYPSNIHFTITSVTSLPEDWTENFDLVHQRLLLPSLRLNEWKGAISEHYRILKPGGYVMFVEIHPDWPKGEGLKANETMCKIFRRMHESRGLLFDCALHIPGWLKDAGFEDIEVDEKQGPFGKKFGKLGEMGSQNTGMVFLNVKEVVLRGGGFGLVSSAEEYDALLDEVGKEWEEKGPHFIWCLITARKPSSSYDGST